MPTRRMPTFEIVHPVPVCTGVWKREINVKIKSGLNPEFQRRSRAARAALYWRARGSVSATRAAGLNFRRRATGSERVRFPGIRSKSLENRKTELGLPKIFACGALKAELGLVQRPEAELGPAPKVARNRLTSKKIAT